jgi:hypothetical protein
MPEGNPDAPEHHGKSLQASDDRRAGECADGDDGGGLGHEGSAVDHLLSMSSTGGTTGSGPEAPHPDSGQRLAASRRVATYPPHSTRNLRATGPTSAKRIHPWHHLGATGFHLCKARPSLGPLVQRDCMHGTSGDELLNLRGRLRTWGTIAFHACLMIAPFGLLPTGWYRGPGGQGAAGPELLFLHASAGIGTLAAGGNHPWEHARR